MRAARPRHLASQAGIIGNRCLSGVMIAVFVGGSLPASTATWLFRARRDAHHRP